MSPSLPPQSRLPPRPPQQAAQHAHRPGPVPPITPGVSKIRPAIFAVGIFGIVGSGALIGAFWKTGRQEEAARKQVERLTTTSRDQQTPQQPDAAVQPINHVPGDKEYDQLIKTLESKRAQFLAQKIGLEKKLRDFHQSQRRKAQEEKERKEFGMKR